MTCSRASRCRAAAASIWARVHGPTGGAPVSGAACRVDTAWAVVGAGAVAVVVAIAVALAAAVAAVVSATG